MASGFSVKIYRSSGTSRNTRTDGSTKSVTSHSKTVYIGFLTENSRSTEMVKSRYDPSRHSSKEIQPSIIPFIYNGGGDNTCSICRDNFRIGENVEILSACLHKYHPACLAEWLKKKRNCPTCRWKC